jgi:hypothetical protein
MTVEHGEMLHGSSSDIEFAYFPQSSIISVLARCACRKLNPGILVMQSAQGWATKNVPGAIDGARDRCIFLQG